MIEIIQNNHSADKRETDYFDLRGLDENYYHHYKLPQYIFKNLPEDKNAKILDLGCGLGQTLNELKKLGYKNISGIDISDESVKAMNNLKIPITKVNDIAEFANSTSNSSSEKYDFLIMSHVLEHIEKNKMIETLSAIRTGLMNEKSKFMVMVPNAQSYTGAYWRYEDFTHSWLFTSGSLFYVLKSAGFGHIEFVDPLGLWEVPSSKRWAVKLFMKYYKWRTNFWNKITQSSFHRESPQIFTFELKALVRK
ncbi:hypothetical protein BH10BAC5_BH10BAC5_09610 [soil metagenome]